MSPPNRSGRGDTRKPTSLEENGIDHGRNPWGKRQYFPTEGEVHLSSLVSSGLSEPLTHYVPYSAMFAKTVYMDNEGCDPRNGPQYEGQQKTHSDGGVFSLQADNLSLASSPTMPAAWKQTPSIKSGSTQATGNDKDKVPYRPTTARLSELSELGTFPTKPASLYQTSESIEEDERESEYTPRSHPGPSSSAVPLPGAGEVSPVVGSAGFGSGDLGSDKQQQQQPRQWRGQ